MNYIALARKWRPKTFSQLVGQNHITKALIKSLDQQRLHHAYLFTGTRGVGKTSVARLLAKAMNCEQGISSEPCLNCDTCISIEQGRFIDLIEIDGASKTRVEDTRDILENVQYAPTHGRFKIYLIDEVHMLSQHSFNALLKTLEEPPSHVKFILATTDPQKLPVTILSRCLQFNLKHLQSNIISDHLKLILDDEKITYELPALSLLANAAQGSMRDALSLLDQAIASADNQLSLEEIQSMLGFTQQDYALQLLQALAELNPQQLLTLSRQVAEDGGHFRYVLDGMLNYLHQICILQHLNTTHELISTEPSLKQLSTQFAPEDAQLFYQIGLKGIQDMPLAPTLAIGFEMIMLRMYAFKPAAAAQKPRLTYEANLDASHSESAMRHSESTTHHSESTTRHSEPTTRHSEPTTRHSERSEESPDAYEIPHYVRDDVKLTANEKLTANVKLAENNIDLAEKKLLEERNWNAILPRLKLSGLAQNAAENAEFIDKTDSIVTLGIEKNHESVFTAAVLKRIEEALTQYYNETIKLVIQYREKIHASPAQQKKVTQEKQQHEAEVALQNDVFFQQLQQEFSAELVKNSISTVKDEL